MEMKKKCRIRISFCIFLVLGLLLVVSCGFMSDPSAKTAQEFVEKYSKAYSNGNTDLIVKMTELGKGQTEESLKDETQKDIDAKGFGYVAWSNTRYLSEQDRANYIRVNVEVKGAQTSIVLIKRDGTLKLAQNPGDFE